MERCKKKMKDRLTTYVDVDGDRGSEVNMVTVYLHMHMYPIRLPYELLHPTIRQARARTLRSQMPLRAQWGKRCE